MWVALKRWSVTTHRTQTCRDINYLRPNQFVCQFERKTNTDNPVKSNSGTAVGFKCRQDNICR